MPLCNKCKRQIERGKKRCPFCGAIQKSFRFFNVPTRFLARLWYFGGLVAVATSIVLMFFAFVLDSVEEISDRNYLFSLVGLSIIYAIGMFASSWIEDNSD